MAKIDCFEELDVWRHAAEIGIEVYGLADELPLSKDFKSRDQLIGTVISISNNIAEGFEYNNNKDFIRFLAYAKGSVGELRSQAFVLYKAGRIKEEDYWGLKESLLNISKEIKGFINYLKAFENNKK
ncbi:four helix bundle protein [Echinicola rosea]|uniref:Four helix bundle protein n=1 Tax=Echinicola rosea TaxID=1807691 RepID=A0ABQ1V3W7_9BACT|nr:four helix bundle protein [Echinicola rosea]GGF37262.1 four helix bundle protein [Echinicola rosea]